MTKLKWIILLISAVTDFIISGGGCLSAAMVAAGNTQLPTLSVLIISVLTGLVAASRKVQQELKRLPDGQALLDRGDE